MTCEVCDKGGRLEELRGFLMHVKCAPAAWVKDKAELEAFMVRVRSGGWWTWPEKRKGG